MDHGRERRVACRDGLNGGEHLVGELRAVYGELGRGEDPHHDLVAVDLLERDARRVAGAHRDALVE